MTPIDVDRINRVIAPALGWVRASAYGQYWYRMGYRESSYTMPDFVRDRRWTGELLEWLADQRTQEGWSAVDKIYHMASLWHLQWRQDGSIKLAGPSHQELSAVAAVAVADYVALKRTWTKTNWRPQRTPWVE